MVKLCFLILFIFVNCLIISYMWYVHYEVKMKIRIKSTDDINNDSDIKDVEKEKSIEIVSVEKVVDVKETNSRNKTSSGNKLSPEVRVLCWIMTTPVNHKSKAQKVPKIFIVESVLFEVL